MPTYEVLYNRLTSQNVGPEEAPATVDGDTPKEALKNYFGYVFRRVYGEAMKSPDVVLYVGRNRHSYIAVSKAPKVVRVYEKGKPKDAKNRYVKRKN